MGDWSNTALQTVFWNCANLLRREAKLCDIVLYVQNRRGFMVGHPAHKILLISTSKYFKLLFEREDLRNFCHFPHLNEEGLVSVLDVIYGRELDENVSLEDALLAARFLQVEIAVEVLEKKQVEKQSRKNDYAEDCENSLRLGSSKSHLVKSFISNSGGAAHSNAEVRIFRNVKNTESESHRTENKKRKISYTDRDKQQDSQMSDSEMSPSQEEPVSIKIEPDIDLTEEGDNCFNPSIPQISFVHGGDAMVDDGSGRTFVYPTEGNSEDGSFDSSNMGFHNQTVDPNTTFRPAHSSELSAGFQGENMTEIPNRQLDEAISYLNKTVDILSESRKAQGRVTATSSSKTNLKSENIHQLHAEADLKNAPKMRRLVENLDDPEKYTVMVDRFALQRAEGKAALQADPAGYLLNELIDLVFTKPELAETRGLGLRNNGNKENPVLDQSKVDAIKVYLDMTCTQNNWRFCSGVNFHKKFNNKICNARRDIKAARKCTSI